MLAMWVKVRVKPDERGRFLKALKRDRKARRQREKEEEKIV